MALIRWRLPLCLTVAALLFAGCSGAGPQRAEVSGTVKINGQAVPEGAINFFPDKGTKGPEAGAAIKDGKFHIPRDQGPIVGTNRIVLRAFQKTGRKIQDPTAPPGTLTDEIANIFPPDVADNSTLFREVQPSDNVFDFDIPVKKGK